MSHRTKLLLKENNELEKQIQNKDNKSALTDMIVYIRSANISSYYQEKVRRDIWEMIVNGEKRGETTRDIIGDDYKLFCDNVIAEVPKLSNKEQILSSVRDVLPAVNVLLIIWLFFNLAEQVSSADTLPYLTVTMGNLICAAISIAAAFGIFRTISKNSFNIDVFPKKRCFLILFILFLICISPNIFVKYSLFKFMCLPLQGELPFCLLYIKFLTQNSIRSCCSLVIFI